MTGINAIKQAKKIFQNEILQYLIENGWTEVESKEMLRELPIIYAVKNEDRNPACWCFIIEDETPTYLGKFLAVSVVLNQKNVIDEFFMVSIDDFSKMDSLYLRQNDDLYNKSKLDMSIQEIIIQLPLLLK